jgi:ABC-type transport system involved in multi-copper enzyme maturation permease subunit
VKQWLGTRSLISSVNPYRRKTMVLAIVRKELRETRAFAALALGLYLLYVIKLTGHLSPLLTRLLGWAPGMNAEPPHVPFVGDQFLAMSLFIGGALAIALGFRQSAWEPSQGTALYLLHLPLARRTIFATKLVTGIGLLLVCTLLPILLYATWAAAPGTHPGPFEWTMTGPALRVWLLMPLAYLGAFASGIRPARWFGSRLLPLVSVALPATLAYALPLWWLIGLPLLLLVAAVLLGDILWVAETRDF